MKLICIICCWSSYSH